MRRFDEQLNTANQYSEKEYTATENCLDKLEELFMMGELSQTQHSTLNYFVVRCHKYGYKKVQKQMSKQLFSTYYCKVKKLTNFDLKVMCKDELPIMRIMEVYGESWLERGLKDLYFDIPDYEKARGGLMDFS